MDNITIKPPMDDKKTNIEQEDKSQAPERPDNLRNTANCGRKPAVALEDKRGLAQGQVEQELWQMLRPGLHIS